MKNCSHFRQKLVLFHYQELTPLEQAEVAAHLQACPQCRTELGQLRQTLDNIPGKPVVEPGDEFLTPLRNVVSEKVKLMAKQAQHRHWTSFSFVHPKPVFQFAFAGLLILLGFFAGQFIDLAPKTKTVDPLLEKMLAFNESVQFPNGALEPFIGNIERINFDSEKQTIEILYNTINDVRLQGTLDNRTIRELVQQALVEESSVAVRLHAVKAVNALSVAQEKLAPEIVETLISLLKNEENQGVRLQILKILKRIPLTTAIKNVLVRILMYDTNSAVRIEAFQILANAELEAPEWQHFLRTAQEDTNSFIRYSAEKLLKNSQNEGPKELSRRE